MDDKTGISGRSLMGTLQVHSIRFVDTQKFRQRISMVQSDFQVNNTKIWRPDENGNDSEVELPNLPHPHVEKYMSTNKLVFKQLCM
jgi:hypothetical protein